LEETTEISFAMRD